MGNYGTMFPLLQGGEIKFMIYLYVVLENMYRQYSCITDFPAVIAQAVVL